MNRVRLPFVLALPAAFALAPFVHAAPAATSPLQRDIAGSPVHWVAWDAALPARAKQANKPVYVFLGSFLSELSRATCRQTFANADTAAFLDANFLCVFVDKDEQPELAAAVQYYLRDVKQMEGWPAHLWLTPELQPFEGANYLPPTEEWGKASFMKIAQQAQAAWASDAPGVRSHAAETVARLAAAPPAVKASTASPEKLSAAAAAWRARFDATHGGFGDTPKNPEPELLRFLLKQSPADRDAAHATLRALAGSALRDPLDGGFFRYASDVAWHLPYQQKTLADQARLALAFLDGATASEKDAPAFAAAARGALDYALKRLVHADGTFAAAEDATDDEHAGYYAWTEAEIDAALGADAAAFKRAHGVTAAGNVSADDDPSGRYQGKNLLRSALPADAKDAAASATLLAARDKRPAITRDERATAGTHGLLLAALSPAGAQLHEPRYLDAAPRPLAAAQRARGIPGACINLGMLGEAGFVARSAAMTDYLASAGWRPITNGEALRAVRTALSSDNAALTFAPADWQRLLQGEPALAGSPRLAPLMADQAGTIGGEGLARLQPSARKAAAMAAIRNEIAAVLRLDPAKIPAADPLGDLGLDSLSSFELWHRIEAALVMPVPLARFNEAPTLEALSELACTIAAGIADAESDPSSPQGTALLDGAVSA